MDKYINKKIVFILPGEDSRISVLREILETTGLSESVKEYNEKNQQGKETRFGILGDAAIAMTRHKMPNDKVAELLAKHLETSKETAQNIVKELQEKLIPYAKIADAETGKIIGQQENTKDEYNKEAFKETLLQKVRGSVVLEPEPEAELEPKIPNLKKVGIEDVEKNAKTIQHAQQRQPAPKPQVEEKKPQDPYKESLE